MLAKPAAFPGPASLARLSGRVGLAAFALPVVGGLVTLLGHHPARTVAGVMVALGAAFPLFLARRRGSVAFAVVATVGVVLLGNGNSHAIVWFGLLVLAAWCILSGGVIVGLVYGVGTVFLFGSEWLWVIRDPGWAPWIGGVTVSVLATFLIRHEFVLVERLRAVQGDLAERSRTEERSRIARELHDVIAHSLTVCLLHVSSARLAVEHDPADAARALAEAERLGRASLAEVRATMGLLRPPADGPVESVTPPVPSLDQVPRLVEQLHDLGADIRLALAGDVISVPGTTGSTAYRIVQEALTNATKHAPQAAVNVRIAATTQRLEISIDSSGPPGNGSGMGRESMEERARAVGGVCTAGPGGSGWLVRASLPMTSDDDRDAP